MREIFATIIIMSAIVGIFALGYSNGYSNAINYTEAVIQRSIQDGSSYYFDDGNIYTTRIAVYKYDRLVRYKSCFITRGSRTTYKALSFVEE